VKKNARFEASGLIIYGFVAVVKEPKVNSLRSAGSVVLRAKRETLRNVCEEVSSERSLHTETDFVVGIELELPFLLHKNYGKC
jgi:hypothetical protein